jgi:DNA-binding CsgD family transcriptional regulator
MASFRVIPTSPSSIGAPLGACSTGSAVVTFVAIRRSSYLSVVPTFSRREVRDALALIDVAYSADGPEPFAEGVVEALARLVPGEIVGYNERELVSHRLLTAREAPLVDAPGEVAEAVSTFCGEYPLSMLKRRSETRALKISDFVSARELHRLDYYNLALRPLGIEHQMRLWLSAPPGVARYFYVSRRQPDGDFTEGDRDLFELLRPFLDTLRERFDGHAAHETNGSGLTDREAEILAWVARGKTNREIAGLLVVSPHTVRKHLEHAFKKLRVHTRAAAVARVFESTN